MGEAEKKRVILSKEPGQVRKVSKETKEEGALSPWASFQRDEEMGLNGLVLGAAGE